MTARVFTGGRERSVAAAPRVGMFGLFGSGNIGNDGSLDAMLRYLRAAHPDAILDVMCPGPERIRAGYGVAATSLQWYIKHADRTSGMAAIMLKALGKGIDAFRTAAWVRRHDVVIVPGTGILETTLPLRPWGTPYALFLLCASGRLFGTKVALVSVGASVASRRLTRRLFTSAARLAFYRSYRDAQSRDAMRLCGLDTAQDPVYPDLAFSLPAPADDPGATLTVGVGVMDYYGGNDDRRRADEMHASYVAKMKCFVQWLVDSGRRVRLFAGDDVDGSVVQEVLADLRTSRPDLEPARVAAEPVSSLSELIREMAAVDTVVATRYHNVLCALKLSKPTLSIGYATKNGALMTDMGLSGFCQSAGSLDIGQLIGQFTELESRSTQLRQTMKQRNTAYAQRLDHQFAVLSTLLFPASQPPRAGSRVGQAGMMSVDVAGE
jgi:polysaccharide pyruvyl transferase WcaK-like protein